MTFDWSSGELAEGLLCYRREDFFEAHEHWEIIWLQCQEPEKTFLQGLIQVTAALHHLQRNNTLGATSLLKAALRRLESYPARYAGIEAEVFREEVHLWIHSLSHFDLKPEIPFPSIQLNRAP